MNSNFQVVTMVNITFVSLKSPCKNILSLQVFFAFEPLPFLLLNYKSAIVYPRCLFCCVS